MQKLTQQGQNIVSDLSSRYGFSTDAVTHMLFAVLNGNGSMAQFNHPEFGGGGQWMRGGMLMLGDMFNYSLKGSVDALCVEIADILAREPGLLHSGSFQSQSQSGGGRQTQAAGGVMGESSLFVPDPEANWWPKDLGAPSASGSQNNVRYAYFAGGHRLAVKTNGSVWVYDTRDHKIGGFSQQQGSSGSILFTSQYGTVNLSTLPVVTIDGQPPASAPSRTSEAPASPVSDSAAAPVSDSAPSSTPSSPSLDTLGSQESGSHRIQSESDIFAALERLGDLRAKGILSEEEFSKKKTELLERL